MAEALTAARILEALDAEAARGDFPAFDNLNVDYISSRLTAYRGESEWAIVFNSIAWMDQSITTIVAPIGNCVEFTRTSEIAQKSLADSEEAGRYREALEATKGQSFFGALFTAFRATRAANEWMRTKGSEVLAEAERARQAAMASGVTEDHKFIGTGEIAIDYGDDGAQKVRSVSVRGRSIPLPTLTIEPKMHVHGDLGVLGGGRSRTESS